jgi:hypothetical protein
MNITCFVSAFALALVATVANAATIEYRFLINGELRALHNLAPGSTNTLRVEARVLDNVVTGSTLGGFIQASFDLWDNGDAIIYKESAGFLGGQSGFWGSTTNAKFGNHNEGVVSAGRVIQETGSILPGNWNADFAAVGANVWSTIATGQFTLKSTPTRLHVASTVAVNSIATLNGTAIGGKLPDSVTGYSAAIGLPEPATFAMAGMALVGMVAAGRRRRTYVDRLATFTRGPRRWRGSFFAGQSAVDRSSAIAKSVR